MTKETDKEVEAKKLLNNRQIVFVQEYMKTNNITQSAINAGYSVKTAAAHGCRLLKQNNVRRYINAINERLQSCRIADIQEVMVSVQDRTRAASELARRLDVQSKNINVDARVLIVDDIPEDAELEEEDNEE